MTDVATPTASAVLANQPAETSPAPQSQASVESKPAQPEVAKPQAKEDKNFARSFSALSRKEREIRQREQALAEKEKATSATGDFEAFKKKLKLNPTEALQDAGVSFDYLTQVFLDNGQVPEQTKKEIALQEKLSALEARLSKYEKSSEPVSQEEQVLNEFIEGLEEHVQTNNEKYKLIVAQEAVPVVYDVIEQAYARSVEQGNPRIMSYEEAADMVEEYLKGEIKKLAEAQGFIAKPADSQGQESPKSQSQGSSSSHTLSNQLNTTKPNETGSRLLSKEESLARAATLLRYT